MAFISAVDYLKRIYVDEPTEVKNADGTYTITNPKGTMVIDPRKDTLHFDNFENFVSAKANSDGTEMDVAYIKEHEPVSEGEIKGLDLDLSPYKIDIIEYDGKTYFPVSSIGLLFSETYNTALYSEDDIYFIHSSDIVMGTCYFTNSKVYNTLKRSKSMAELAYNDLCFAFDKLYGRPAKSEIASVLDKKALMRHWTSTTTIHVGQKNCFYRKIRLIMFSERLILEKYSSTEVIRRLITLRY